MLDIEQQIEAYKCRKNTTSGESSATYDGDTYIQVSFPTTLVCPSLSLFCNAVIFGCQSSGSVTSILELAEATKNMTLDE
jgi:hypothetical protein